MDTEQNNIEKLLQLLENAPNPIVKKTLILRLARYPLAETEAIFIDLFDDFDERVIAATIEGISNYQKIEHFDYFAKFITSKSSIVKRTLTRAIWLYDINEKIRYCRKVADSNQKDKFNFVSEILRGIDTRESIDILDHIRQNGDTEQARKAAQYQKELMDKLSQITPGKIPDRKKLILIGTTVTAAIVIICSALFLLRPGDARTPVRDHAVSVQTAEATSEVKVVESKLPEPVIKETKTQPVVKPAADPKGPDYQDLIQKGRYADAQGEMLKLLPEKLQDVKFVSTLIKVNKKLSGKGLDEILKACRENTPLSLLVYKFKLVVAAKEDYLEILKALVRHPSFSLKTIEDEGLSKLIEDVPLSSSFLKKQSDLVRHFFLNLVTMKYENALTIFERIDDAGFRTEYKKVSEMLLKHIKYSNLNHEPFKYYSLQINQSHFNNSKDFRDFKTILIYVYRGKLQQAQKVLNSISFKDPYFKSFLEGLFLSRYLSSPSKSAGKFLESMKGNSVNLSELKFFLGKAYFDVGFFELAEKFFQECHNEAKDTTIKTLAYDYLFSIYRKEKRRNNK